MNSSKQIHNYDDKCTYIERERKKERKKERKRASQEGRNKERKQVLNTHIYIYIHTHIYIERCIYRGREREI